MDSEVATRRADTVMNAVSDIVDDSLGLYRWYQARDILATLLAVQEVDRVSHTQLRAWVANRDLSSVESAVQSATGDPWIGHSLGAFKKCDTDEQAQTWALLAAVLNLAEALHPDQ